MDINNNVIKSIKPAIVLSGEQGIELELNLPDYYDNIDKILKCTVKPITEATSVSEGRISVAGTASVVLLFCGENKKLYKYENEVKYTKVFQCKEVELSDYVSVKQKAVSVNFRALGPKRIDVRSVLEIKLNISGIKNFNIIDNIKNANDIQCQKLSCSLFSPSFFGRRDFSVFDKYVLPNGKTNCFVIHKDCNCLFDEIKVIQNKIYVKGNVNVFGYYFCLEDDKIDYFSLSIPFSEVIDAFDIKENDIVTINDLIYDVVILEKEENETSVFETSVKISFCILSGKEDTTEYITDIYSIKNELDSVFNEINCISSNDATNIVYSVKQEINSFDDEISQIECAFVDDVSVNLEYDDMNAKIIISAQCNAIIRRSDTSLYLISRNITQEENIGESKGLNKNTVFSYEVTGVSAVKTPDDKILFSFDIKLRYNVCVTNTIECLSSTQEKNKKNIENSGIVIYYGSKNEEIWDIAKTNNATVDAIKTMNSIDENCLKEDRVLLFYNYV